MAKTVYTFGDIGLGVLAHRFLGVRYCGLRSYRPLSQSSAPADSRRDDGATLRPPLVVVRLRRLTRLRWAGLALLFGRISISFANIVILRIECRSKYSDGTKDFMRYDSGKLLLAVDLAGTLLFGMEGATAAIAGHLDLLGLMVLAFATALCGGIIRDLLIGAVPPDSLRDWRYSAAAFTGATIVFFLHRSVEEIPVFAVIVLDAAGLALFAVAGTEKALLYKMHPFIAILLGTITGVGGGTIRDMMLAQVPIVLRADVYATAAIAGSAGMVLGRRLRLPPTLAAIAGGMICFSLRLVSVWRHWNLPTVSG
jgi:uncharacterized membrane protein YeiH